jgi:hypothetical protein
MLSAVGQVSMPLRIAFVATLLLIAAWFTVLKPGDDAGEAPLPAAAPPAAEASGGPTAPGVTGLVTAVDKAKGAAAVSDARNAQTDLPAPEGGSTAATPAQGAAGASAGAGSVAQAASRKAARKPKDAGDHSARYLRALRAGKVVVLLFWERKAADDRAVRAAVRRVDRRGGKVVVGIEPIGDLADFEAITTGVQVTEAPTVLVISPQRTARAVVGFTTTAELDQLVADARRAATAR